MIDPTDKFLIVANQNSSNLVLFSRDPETGKLDLLQKDTYRTRSSLCEILIKKRCKDGGY